jgi:5-deoxy-glucuronate isomerase
MSKLHFKPVTGKGVNLVADSSNSHMEYLSLNMMNLAAGEEQSWKADGVESALVLLSGSVEMSGAGLSVSGSRNSLFEDRATAFYAPPGTEVTVKAAGDSQVAICSCKATGKKAPFVIKPGELTTFERGTGNFSREICMIIDPERDVNHLTLGETVNHPGNWSSYPPHRHEIDRPPVETDLEEIYQFHFDPKQGFGFIRVYTEDFSTDETMTVEEGDTVIIKEGFHPLAAGGGYKLHYLWFLGGDKRELAAFDDPKHAWVKKLG